MVVMRYKWINKGSGGNQTIFIEKRDVFMNVYSHTALYIIFVDSWYSIDQ